METWKPLDYVGHVTCLSFGPKERSRFLYFGIGSFLHCFDTLSGKHLFQQSVFGGHKIHGMRFFGETDQIVLFGSRRLMILSILFDEYEIPSAFVINTEFNDITDLILDCTVLMDTILIIGYAHNIIQVWELGDTPELVLQTQCEDSSLLYAFSFFGDTLDSFKVACGTVFNEIFVAHPINLQEELFPVLHRVRAHEGVICAIDWFNSSIFASASDDRTMKVWRICPQGLECLAVADGHIARVYSCLFAHSTRDDESYTIYSGSEDRTCRQWLVEDKGIEEKAVFTGHRGTIWRLACSDDFIATGGSDGDIRLLRRNDTSVDADGLSVQVPEPFELDSTVEREFDRSQSFIRDVYIMNDDRIILVCNLGYILEYTETDLFKIWFYPGKLEKFVTTALSMDKQWMTIGTSSGKVYVVAMRDRDISPLELVLIDELPVFKVFWIVLEDGTQLIAALSQTRTMKFWSFSELEGYPQCRLISQMLLPVGKPLISLDIIRLPSTAYHIVACSDTNKHLMVFLIHPLLDPAAVPPSFTRISPHNGKRIIQVNFRVEDGEIYISSLGRNGILAFHRIQVSKLQIQLIKTGERKIPVKTVDDVQFLPDGTEIASGNDGKDFVVWNFSENCELARFKANGGFRPQNWEFGQSKNFIRYVFTTFDRNKQSQLIVQCKSLTTFLSSQSTGSIHVKFHGRRTTAAMWLPFPSNLFVTGSEDNGIKILGLDQSNAIHVIQSIEQQLRNAISCLDVVRKGDSCLLVSGGSKEHLRCQMVHCNGSVEVVGESGGGSFISLRQGKWWQKSRDQLMEERKKNSDLRFTAICAFDCGKLSAAVAGNSIGQFKVYSIDTFDRNVKCVHEISFHERPILCMVSFLNYIISGDTVGMVKITRWSLDSIAKVPVELFSERIFESGVNCLSSLVFIDETSAVCLCGGDNQAIALCRFDFSQDDSISLTESFVFPLFHSAAVSGVELILFHGQLFAISAGMDCRLILWEISLAASKVSFVQSILIELDDISGIHCKLEADSSILKIIVSGHGIHLSQLDLSAFMVPT